MKDPQDWVLRLYEEIARLAGVTDPKGRVAEVLQDVSGQSVTPEHTEELIRRLEAP